MEQKLKYHYIDRYYNNKWIIEGNLKDTIYDLFNNGDLGSENLNCKFIIYDDKLTVIFLHIIQYGPFAVDLDLGPNVSITIEINIEDEYFSEVVLPENEWMIINKILMNEENELNSIFSNCLKSESINNKLFLNPTYADKNSFRKEILITNLKEAFTFDLNKWKVISLVYLEKFNEIRKQIKIESKN